MWAELPLGSAPRSYGTLGFPRSAPEKPGSHPDQQRDRQADHVPVIPLDLIDQGGSAPLDRVATGALAPLPRGQVPVEVGFLQRPEAHTGSGGFCTLSFRPEERHARMHLVQAS